MLKGETVGVAKDNRSKQQVVATVKTDQVYLSRTRSSGLPSPPKLTTRNTRLIISPHKLLPFRSERSMPGQGHRVDDTLPDTAQSGLMTPCSIRYSQA